MTWYEITGIVLLVVIVGPVVLGFAMHRRTGDRDQLEALAARLLTLDRLLHTTDGPLMDIWDGMRPGLESGLGLDDGSLNSDLDPTGTNFVWKDGWH